MCLNTDLVYRNPPHITNRDIIYVSHLPTVSYFEAPPDRNTKTNTIPCIVLLRSSLLTETLPSQEQKDTGSQETEHNEGGGGSIGNIFPVLSAPSIALNCKKISCDSFDIK